MTLDRLIKNARIIDGTGSPWYRGSLGIKGERIVYVGQDRPLNTLETIDAGGQVVTPGFVDVHTHDDLAVLKKPVHSPKLLQGVTSAVLGNCGFGGAPVAYAHRSKLAEYIAPVLGTYPNKFSWCSFQSYLEDLSENPASVNLVSQVAHGPIRIAVMGFEARHATIDEIEKMCGLVSEAMQAGAVGLSLGLLYAPGCYADNRELIALASTAAREGGILNCHIRTEGNSLLDSLCEVMDIAEAANSPLHISHLKVVGQKNWGTIERALDLIEDRRCQGLDITCDIYTYTAGSSTLLSLLPPWVSSGGAEEAVARLRNPAQRDKIKLDLEKDHPGWDNFVAMLGWERVIISSVESKENRCIEGLSLLEIASARKSHPADCLMDLLVEEKGKVTMILHQMSEEDVKSVLRSEYAMVGSDGLPLETGRIHPRHYGTFPRMLAHYVRDERIMPLEQAVRKMTSISARRFGLKNRGLIAEGMKADLVIFNPSKIQDTATFEDPRQYPTGINYVLVNGKVASTGTQPSGVYNGALTRSSDCSYCCKH